MLDKRDLTVSVLSAFESWESLLSKNSHASRDGLLKEIHRHLGTLN
jgi:hypothetical protein